MGTLLRISGQEADFANVRMCLVNVGMMAGRSRDGGDAGLEEDGHMLYTGGIIQGRRM